MGFIKGQARNQIILFPESIEDYIKEDAIVRIIDAFIDGSPLEDMGFKRVKPAKTGRPPYEPSILAKLYLYGYMNRIRSSRRLETEAGRNLEVMWLLEKLTPDHVTIASFRKNNRKALKELFRAFVRLCNELGLYGKEMCAIDGSKFEAVNSKDKNFSVRKLNIRIAGIDKKIDEYMESMDSTDEVENTIKDNDVKDALKELKKLKELKELKERKAKYEAYKEQLAQTEETQISETDPESRRMKTGNGGFDMSYNVQSSVDSKNKLIAEFEVTNECNDAGQLSKMTEATAEILEVETIESLADTGYDSATEIAKCIMAGHTPHVKGADYDICIETKEASQNEPITSHKDGKCVYLEDRNIVLCPMGNVLYPGSYKNTNGTATFHNSKACKKCPHRCTTGKTITKRFEVKMPKSQFSKEYNDQNLNIKQVRVCGDNEKIRKRKEIVEHPFGTIKRNMDARYILTKGIESVTGEMSLVFLAYNMKRVINILGAKKLMEVLKNRAVSFLYQFFIAQNGLKYHFNSKIPIFNQSMAA